MRVLTTTLVAAGSGFTAGAAMGAVGCPVWTTVLVSTAVGVGVGLDLFNVKP